MMAMMMAGANWTASGQTVPILCQAQSDLLSMRGALHMDLRGWQPTRQGLCCCGDAGTSTSACSCCRCQTLSQTRLQGSTLSTFL